MATEQPMVEHTNTCDVCGEPSTIMVPLAVMERFAQPNRDLIQNIWPDSTPAQREQLKMGTHPQCQFIFGAETPSVRAEEAQSHKDTW